MGAPLPKGWSRCEVHNNTFPSMQPCWDCANEAGAIASPRKFIPIVFGELLAGNSPSARKERAVEAVNKALADGKIAPAASPSLAEQLAQRELDARAASIDPMERMVDGLTVRECLDAFERNQRERPTHHARFVPVSLRGVYLTMAQLAAARLAWSSALRAKQAEVKERDRLSVRCDEQWGEDV